MNLDVYQEFFKILNAFKNAVTHNIEGGENAFEIVTRDKHNKVVPDSDTKEEHEKFIRNTVTALHLLPKATIFEIDEDTAILCAKTKIPKNKAKYAFLPHDPMFIDFRFVSDKFQLSDGDDEIVGLLISERPVVQDVTEREVGKALGVLTVLKQKSGHVFLDSVSFREEIEDPSLKHLKISHPTELSTRPFIQNFVTNLLNFINDPDVQFITHKRDTKNQERRIRQGKLPLPESITVKVTGTLKIYVDDAKKHGGGWHFHFRFPVRSHIRRYRDDAGNIKKEIIIPRHYKGQGLTIDRPYEVKEGDNDRKNKEEELK